MSPRPPDSDWLEKTLESTRRDVRQLEIEACRIRTDLARLEVANAAGVIDGEITARLRDEDSNTSYSQPLQTATTGSPLDWQPAAESAPEGMEILVGAPSQAEEAQTDIQHPQQVFVDRALPELSTASGLISRSRHIYRRATSPFMTSLVLHGAILALAVSITVATIERNDPRFARTILNLGDQPVKESEIVDIHQLADLGAPSTENSVSDSPQFDAVSSLGGAPIPIDVDSVNEATSMGKAGMPNLVSTDLGTLMTGSAGISADGIGEPTGLGNSDQHSRGGSGRADAGRPSSRLDSTLFFGTEARGDRFVFVVDNSSSMKGGRLEMAIAELVKTVNGLSPRQNFYVIFVSDRTYPMFYPQEEPSLVPATPANKRRLTEWLPKAILASGKNRELIKAMDSAASLQPQAVYLLWDGDLRYSEKVRLDVMTHLTRPNQWNFIVHTLGMGITSPESEQNLRTIAQSHHGVYRRIDVPTARTR